MIRHPAAKALLATGGIAGAAIAWWLVSPLFLDSEVDEAFPTTSTAVTTTATTIQEPAAPSTSNAASAPTTTSTTTTVVGPVELASGTFLDADATHRGSGSARIYELEDGSRLLRLEDFEVTNGPDLHVLLVPHEDPRGRDEVAGYLDLGELKGNIGNQNYEIPDGVDLSEYGSIVIYCVPFRVLFSTASLTVAP